MMTFFVHTLLFYIHHQTELLPASVQPTFSLQLSSPVEEITLTKVHDPLDSEAEGSLAVFSGVDTSMATLTVSVKDAEFTLGSSEATDVKPLAPLDAMMPAPQYVSEIPIAIVSDGQAIATMSEDSDTGLTYEDAKEEVVEEGAAGEAGDKGGAVIPVCIVTLRVTYKPSFKDIQDELYDMLNKASQNKAEALDKLRQKAAEAGRVGKSTAAGETSMTTTTSSPRGGSPAVKRGFLNKKKKDEPSKFKAWYDRMLGPQSFLRQTFPIAKNYIVFFGAIAMFHWKGQLLALPPPV
jgi:hypothetical protein